MGLLWRVIGFLAVLAVLAVGYRYLDPVVPQDWGMAKAVLRLMWLLAFAGVWAHVHRWLRWASARRSADPQVRATAARPEVRVRRLIRQYGLLVSILPVLVLSVLAAHRLVPDAWGSTWLEVTEYVLVLFAGIATVLELERVKPRLPAADPPAPVERAAPTAEPTALLARLVWHGGDRQRLVHTSAQLRDQLLHLHLSAVEIPRHVDFVPVAGARVRVGLGGEAVQVLVTPADGSVPYTVTSTPQGLATTPVTFADDGAAVLPPASAIPVEIAIDVLDRYFTTGDLPGAEGSRPALGEGSRAE